MQHFRNMNMTNYITIHYPVCWLDRDKSILSEVYIMQPGRRVVCLLPLLLSPALARQGDRLSVYGPVPGLAPSPYYRLQVREQGEQAWRDTFTLLTECTAEKFCNTTGVSRHLNNWSNSYVNFQMEDGVRQGLNHEE